MSERSIDDGVVYENADRHDWGLSQIKPWFRLPQRAIITPDDVEVTVGSRVKKIIVCWADPGPSVNED